MFIITEQKKKNEHENKNSNLKEDAPPFDAPINLIDEDKPELLN